MRRLVDVRSQYAPIYTVWELTLRCDLACRHCGSRAGLPREQELSLDEALEVVAQLAALGTREVTFIGGEAYLHPDWLAIVRATTDAGIQATMTTGGRALDPALCRAAAEAGMHAMSCSVDGLEGTHDLLRGVKGSWRRAMEGLGHIADAGVLPFANTQINRLNLDELETLGELLLEAGIRAWQVQLTGPMGRAADRPEWLLQPWEMLALGPRLGRLARRAREAGCTLNAANNLGYFGPHESEIRMEYWKGCSAGRHVLGIESNGDVKGCPSLPSAPYVGGNLRREPLEAIWRRLDFARERTAEELWGFCAGCYYAEECMGGCSWTSHTLLGRRGNMPWCFHRATEQRARGIRERLVQVERAEGAPFDFGRFELVEEPWS